MTKLNLRSLLAASLLALIVVSPARAGYLVALNDDYASISFNIQTDPSVPPVSGQYFGNIAATPFVSATPGMAGQSNAMLTIDLKGTFLTQSVTVDEGLFAGAQGFSLRLSNDGINYTTILNNQSIAPGSGLQTFQLGTTYTRFAQFMIPASVSAVITAVPEPASLLMLGSGLVGVLGFARRRRVSVA